MIERYARRMVILIVAAAIITALLILYTSDSQDQAFRYQFF